MSTKLVEIDRIKIIKYGSSPYALIPKFLRRESDATDGDEMVYSRDPDTGRVIIHIEKPENNRAEQ